MGCYDSGKGMARLVECIHSRAEGQVIRLEVGILDCQVKEVLVDMPELDESLGKLGKQPFLGLSAARLQELLQLPAFLRHLRGGRPRLVGEVLRLLIRDGHHGALLCFRGR